MAAGDTLHVLRANGSAPPASGNGAPPAYRNAHYLINFPDAATYGRCWGGVLSRRYGGNGITARVHWIALTATSGNVVWDGAFERHQAGTTDLDADDFASAQSATGTTQGTSGVIRVTEITFTDGGQIDSLAVGESFRFRLQRLGGDGSDSMTDTAQVVAIELRETP